MRKRIFEFAKETGITSKTLIEKLKTIKINVKSHMSSVDEKDIEKLLNELTSKDKTIKITNLPTVSELSSKINIPPSQLIKSLLEKGIIITLNQTLNKNHIKTISKIFNKKIEISDISENQTETLHKEKDKEKYENMKSRPPVVTMMGHVDHGKTSLLDTIRKTNITKKEAGNITQHIGAYMVNLKNHSITFLDTPGHEAFTQLRSRGAKITDIVVLVVAADDGVMPQTIEAINHAKAAKVPIIVAINKIDKTTANTDRVKTQLSELGLVSEDWGGKTIFTEVSAIQNTGIDNLLEMILLEAEMLELKGSFSPPARGVVIEAKLDNRRGAVATILIKNGILSIGDSFVAGTTYGKVKALINDKFENIKQASPSTPVEVIGFNNVPLPGDEFIVTKNEKEAKQIVKKRLEEKKQTTTINTPKHVTLEYLYDDIKKGKVKELHLIIKADVQGSIEVLTNSIKTLDSENFKTTIIHSGMGDINESDVLLADTSNAIIIGFNVKLPAKIQSIAKNSNVEIKTYNVIYEAISDIKDALEGLLKPKEKEVITGKANVKQVFNTSKGKIAGSIVIEGKIKKNDDVRVIRGEKTIFTCKIDSLKRFKDDVKEVIAGNECGIGLSKFQDIKTGDTIEAFQVLSL